MKCPPFVAEVVQRLEQAGYPTFLVGGCVRDALRGIEPHDYDLCTKATPDEVHSTLAPFCSVIPTGLKHGTVTAKQAGQVAEITTFRTEGTYQDGRHPDSVHFVNTVEQDLARRDFTIGAIAYSPTRGMVDPFDGVHDLQAGILRCVGRAEDRFLEDALRILRGLRLCAEHGFTIEPSTLQAMETLAPTMHRLAVERIASECTRLLTAPYAVRVLRNYRTILAHALPELVPMFNVPQHHPYHRYDVWEHTLHALEGTPPALRWAVLLHDSGKPACKTTDAAGIDHFYGHPAQSERIAKTLCHRLKFSNAQTRQICTLVRLHDRPLGETDEQLRKTLYTYGEDTVRDLLMIKKADSLGQGTHREDLDKLQGLAHRVNHILDSGQCVSMRTLAIDGRDFVSLGLKGSAIGHALRRAMHEVLKDPTRNQKEILLKRYQNRRQKDD